MSPTRLGWTLTVAGCVALTLPEGGVAVNQFDALPLPALPFPLANAVTRNVKGFGDGLVIDTVFAAGFVPFSLPTKISPVGATKAPGLLAGDTTFSTTEATCGEFTAPVAENWTVP